MDIVGSRSLPRVGRLRRWLMIVPLFVGLCTLAAQVTADDAKPMGSTTLVALEESVQSLFSLPSLDGPEHELARLRGRVVLVHFFATWCEPCRAEMAVPGTNGALEDDALAGAQEHLSTTAGVVAPLHVVKELEHDRLARFLAHLLVSVSGPPTTSSPQKIASSSALPDGWCLKYPLLFTTPILRPGPVEAKVIHEKGEISTAAPFIVLRPIPVPKLPEPTV